MADQNADDGAPLDTRVVLRDVMERFTEGLDKREALENKRTTRIRWMVILLGVVVVMVGSHMFTLIYTMANDMNNMSEQMTKMSKYMDSMHANMGSMNTHMASMSGDMGVMKTAMVPMAEHVAVMSGDMGEMNAAMQAVPTMQQDVHRMSNTMGYMQQDTHWMRNGVGHMARDTGAMSEPFRAMNFFMPF